MWRGCRERELQFDRFSTARNRWLFFYGGSGSTIVPRAMRLLEEMGAMGKNQHVVSHGEGWAVKAEGASEPLAVFKTQSEAWEKAKSIARKERSEALLHGRNGVIRTRNTYGYDPSRRKG